MTQPVIFNATILRGDYRTLTITFPPGQSVAGLTWSYKITSRDGVDVVSHVKDSGIEVDEAANEVTLTWSTGDTVGLASRQFYAHRLRAFSGVQPTTLFAGQFNVKEVSQ